MAPRSGNKKRRNRPPSSAANGGYYYNAAGAAPPAMFLDDDFTDDIKVMGFTLPGPVSTLLRSLGGVPGQLASLTPMKIIMYGGLAAVLLAPLMDSTIRQSMSLLRGDGSKKVRGGRLHVFLRGYVFIIRGNWNWKLIKRYALAKSWKRNRQSRTTGSSATPCRT